MSTWGITAPICSRTGIIKDAIGGSHGLLLRVGDVKILPVTSAASSEVPKELARLVVLVTGLLGDDVEVSKGWMLRVVLRIEGGNLSPGAASSRCSPFDGIVGPSPFIILPPCILVLRLSRASHRELSVELRETSLKNLYQENLSKFLNAKHVQDLRVYEREEGNRIHALLVPNARNMCRLHVILFLVCADEKCIGKCGNAYVPTR